MIDPITLEVTRNKLDCIAEEMEWTLLSASFSPIVKEGLDASASLFLADGSTLAQACAVPIHLGSLIPSVANILRTFPLHTMEQGDLYCMNDPYAGGTHAPDITVVMPIFYGGRVMALAATMTHHQDIGGMSPGSLPPDATDVFQEGMRLPALRLMQNDKYNDTLLKIMFNNVRTPETLMGDLSAQVAACKTGAQRMQELLKRLGAEEFELIARTLLDRSEELTRRSLMELPSGTYRSVDFLDNDGVELDKPVRIEVAVTLKDGTIHFDMTGTSPQVRGPFNCVPSGAQSAAYFAVRALTDSSIPTNAGCFRPVTLHLPENSLVNPTSPAAVNARAIPVKTLTTNMLAALAEAAPDRVPAFNSNLHLLAFGGVKPDGSHYIVSEMVSGGMGAHARGDGNSVTEGDISNCMNMPCEALELDYPVRVLETEFRTDSGGRGKWRGGLGCRREYLILADNMTLTHRGDHHRQGPRGILGGESGSKAYSYIVKTNGDIEVIPSKAMRRLQKGDRLVVETPGGGGYGRFSERDQSLVQDDLVNLKTSQHIIEKSGAGLS